MKKIKNIFFKDKRVKQIEINEASQIINVLLYSSKCSEIASYDYEGNFLY